MGHQSLSIIQMLWRLKCTSSIGKSTFGTLKLVHYSDVKCTSSIGKSTFRTLKLVHYSDAISKCPFTDNCSLAPLNYANVCTGSEASRISTVVTDIEIVKYVWLHIVVTITFMKRDSDQEAIMHTSLYQEP